MIIDRLDIDPDTPIWFAMQATQKRELAAQIVLKRDNIESFIPMKDNVSIEKGRKRIGQVPVVSNLMFVFASKNYMKDIKSKVPYLQFKHRTEGGLYHPIIVPTKQMSDFIKLYEASPKDKIKFYSPDDPALKVGREVRVHKHGGELDGVEGVLVTIKGRRNRQLSVRLGDFTALVTEINADLIELI